MRDCSVFRVFERLSTFQRGFEELEKPFSVGVVLLASVGTSRCASFRNTTQTKAKKKRKEDVFSRRRCSFNSSRRRLSTSLNSFASASQDRKNRSSIRTSFLYLLAIALFVDEERYLQGTQQRCLASDGVVAAASGADEIEGRWQMADDRWQTADEAVFSSIDRRPPRPQQASETALTCVQWHSAAASPTAVGCSRNTLLASTHSSTQIAWSRAVTTDECRQLLSSLTPGARPALHLQPSLAKTSEILFVVRSVFEF